MDKLKAKRSLCDILRENILVCKKFNETVDSLNKMTIDEVLWLNEIIEIGDYLDTHWDRERKRVEDIKNRQPKY